MDARLETFDTKMQKSLNNLEEEYSAIRAGRANPHVLDKLKVDYYGTPTPIQSVANVNVPEPRMIPVSYTHLCRGEIPMSFSESCSVC